MASQTDAVQITHILSWKERPGLDPVGSDPIAPNLRRSSLSLQSLFASLKDRRMPLALVEMVQQAEKYCTYQPRFVALWPPRSAHILRTDSAPGGSSDGLWFGFPLLKMQAG